MVRGGGGCPPEREVRNLEIGYYQSTTLYFLSPNTIPFLLIFFFQIEQLSASNRKFEADEEPISMQRRIKN